MLKYGTGVRHFMDINSLVKSQRQFAHDGQAKSIFFRKEQLAKLKKLIKQYEESLYQAIYQDFKKSSFETYVTELALVNHEIDVALKNLSKWAAPKKVKTGLANQPGKSYILAEPYGTTLIIGAWNYPYQLTLGPLVAAIGAGNTAIIKPSELPQNTSSVLTHLINEHFDAAYIHVIEGDAAVTQELLTYRFDKLFFTGSTHVGRIVAKAAAEHLTPITLELGGKSPCFVFADADLTISAKRIVWGKFLNAGQTCIAPDYLLVEKEIYSEFMIELKKQITLIVGENPLESESYSRIINQAHVKRLQELLKDKKKIFTGGKIVLEEHYVEPTILQDIDFQDNIMKEEIFGPILPVIPFTDLDAMILEIKAKPRPLALYLFGKDKGRQEKILRSISFGGGCINDVLMHISNLRLPFGGVGESGMGSYHGESGFNAFSHFKGILQKKLWFEPPLKYAPYSQWKLKLIKLLLG